MVIDCQRMKENIFKPKRKKKRKNAKLNVDVLELYLLLSVNQMNQKNRKNELIVKSLSKKKKT